MVTSIGIPVKNKTTILQDSYYFCFQMPTEILCCFQMSTEILWCFQMPTEILSKKQTKNNKQMPIPSNPLPTSLEISAEHL